MRRRSSTFIGHRNLQHSVARNTDDNIAVTSKSRQLRQRDCEVCEVELMCCVIARWFALQARHSATACYVKSWWRDGAMCDATVKQYNVLQCPYPDTVFIFGNINTSSTHLFVFQWFAINLVLDWNIFHIGWNCQTVIINGCRFRLTR